LAGVVGLCLLVAAAGCEGEASRPGPVLLVGDSIFFQATDELSWVLGSDGWEVTVDAEPGSGIRNSGFNDDIDWPSRLSDLVAYLRPEVVVVELGTNGCGRCESIADAIRDDMESLRGVEHVLWLKVATFGPQAARGREVNAELERAADNWDNLELLPYDEWFAGQTDLVPADDVHPTQAGQRALARHVGDALDARAETSEDGRGRALGALVVVIVAAALLRRSPT
jgi:lysophospholipase L1-like esterase